MSHIKATGPALAQSLQPMPGSDLSEIPAQLHYLNIALDDAENQLASLAEHMGLVLRPIPPTGPSEDHESLVPPVATPLGSSIQSARFQVERVTNRLINLRSRLGL